MEADVVWNEHFVPLIVGGRSRIQLRRERASESSKRSREWAETCKKRDRQTDRSRFSWFIFRDQQMVTFLCCFRINRNKLGPVWVPNSKTSYFVILVNFPTSNWNYYLCWTMMSLLHFLKRKKDHDFTRQNLTKINKSQVSNFRPAGQTWPNTSVFVALMRTYDRLET